MKQRYLQKVGSFLMASAMVLIMFPTISTSVHAEENQSPMKEQFATVDELRKFNTNDNDGEKNPAKVYFGNNSQQWWIAGSQNDNEIVLFSEKGINSNERYKFAESNADIAYEDSWNCVYPSDSTITEVNASHYGASLVRASLTGMETSYFTKAEQDKMKETEIYTYDTAYKNVYSTKDKLYLAYGGYDNKYVTAGANTSTDLNTGLRIDEAYWGDTASSMENWFWLRSPALTSPTPFYVVSAVGQGHVGASKVTSDCVLRPAFAMDLTDVLFGSTVPAVSSDGQQSINDAMTLRYQQNMGTAKISSSKRSVSITDVTNENTYLVVQNSKGAWAKKVTNNEVVFAGEMNEELTSFDDCKVWLESSDTADRMTYATYATQATGHNVKINVGDTMTISQGNVVQTNITGEIADIVITAKDEYIFLADYTVAEQNGIIVTRDNENQITISGTPTDDVNITLPPATKKVYSMTLDGSGTFTGTCVGYEPIAANEFTITNKGNVDLENVNVSMTGTNAEQFELSWDKTAAIQPNETIKVTVKPKDGLAVNTYQATLFVSADNATDTTKTVQFIVSEHDYNAVVIPPTCTEKGYTTYTCKNCHHSYVGDEVPANGHTWGEWTIIDAPTCEQGGSRKRICLECGKSEVENLNPNGHEWEDDYTTDKEPTCTEDGSKSIHCKHCEAVKDSQVITKLGHSFTNYISNNDATCTKDGTKTAKCDRCGETDTIVDAGTMLEHEYEWVYNNDGTCEKNGTETGTCRNCPATITREKADTALGHDFKNYVSDDNATCTENGTETAKCERCDKTDTRIAENSALGHKLGEWKVVKEATATETGEEERVCERCDYKETEVIPMISKEEQPSVPTKPNNGDNNNTDNNNTASKTDKPNTAVQTGDSTNVLLWSMVAVISMAGVITALIFKRRRSR